MILVNSFGEHDEDLEPYFCFSATLRIFGEIDDLDGLSQLMSLRPSNFHRKGERKGPRSPEYEHDMWSYQVPVAENRPLDIHIKTLWAQIKHRKAELLALKSHCTVDIFCGYRSNSRTAGFEVSPSALEVFQQLDIPFEVSVIIT